jgi:transcriptional regulator with XRE-family HTH domain
MAREHERYAATLSERVAQRLDELRQERDVSVNWLADFSGLDRGYMSRLLRGKVNPSLRTLALIANALDVPFRSLFEVEEPERPGPPARKRATKVKKD